MTAIKTDDIISTLQHLALIQYVKGQHVLCAAPSVIDRVLKGAGSAGLEVQCQRPFPWRCHMMLLTMFHLNSPRQLEQM